ncbi:WD40 repeat-like protein [Suillus brevipes Sb2]|nr:WD40 repeat-like protein [Suillus brevipes Sb2]
MSNRPPKSALCTLSMHTGPVLTIRWAHSGRWLASGSDDEIVMIWDLDPGKVFGSNEVNVEGWKPMKRLPGHESGESDVTDLAWAPEDRYLASVGLDSVVLVWCGYTLERLRKLDQHQGFVKGVCWDPVGEFMATQSDDKSVKIWRTTDWQLEAEIRKPFEDSPGSTWSPDGAHITASNATNNKGFVFIAAVITRGTWTSEISLVGHENTVEVAAYNPHIFLRNPASPIATSNICSVVALGADDRSISIWQTKSARPLIVAREVFERQIMDLSWSWDGLTLYAASSDGTIAVFHFDPEELEGIAPHSAQEQYLHKFGFVPPPTPEGFSHGSFTHSTNAASASRITPPPSPNRAQSQSQSQSGFGASNGINGAEHINKLVAKKSNKKRVQPLLMSSVPSASTSRSVLVSTSALPPSASGLGPRAFQVPEIPRSRQASHSASPVPSPRTYDADIEMGGPMDMDVPIDALDTSMSSASKGKRKASVLDMSEDRPSKPRTLGGDRPRETVAVREIASTSLVSTRPHLFEGANLLPVPPLLTFLSANVEGSDLTKISERWWAEGSDVWQGRQRTSKDKDVVASIEGATGSTSIPAPHKERPTWWNTALTLGHLESKLHAAKTLDSELADEGFRAKAEELIKEFFGPIFWRPGGRDESSTPVVAGMAKRDLLRKVLSVFLNSKKATPWRSSTLSAPIDNCTRAYARKPTCWSSSESPRKSDDLDRPGRNVVEGTPV